MLGLAPQDFDLKKSTIDLVSEQAAAFYDYHRKRLFILESTPEGAGRRMALVHELAHALADQHHNLGRFIRRGAKTEEGATARQAVMEGQASWLTAAYFTKLAGGSAEAPKSIVDADDEPVSADPVFSQAPLYLRESLIFPYVHGLRFQDAVWRKLGRASFDAVFRTPPCSSQQILHPEVYFERRCPPEIEPPKFKERGFKKLIEGGVSELDHRILLRQHAGEKEAEAQCRTWRAGAVRIFETKKKDRQVMAYASEWASEDAAREYMLLYRRVLAGKWKKLVITGETSDRFEGLGDTGRFVVERSGGRVSSIEGF